MWTTDLYSHLPPKQARRARRNAMILALAEQGWSNRAIADVLALSRQLVDRIVEGGESSLPQIRRQPAADRGASARVARKTGQGDPQRIERYFSRASSRRGPCHARPHIVLDRTWISSGC